MVLPIMHAWATLKSMPPMCIPLQLHILERQRSTYLLLDLMLCSELRPLMFDQVPLGAPLAILGHSWSNPLNRAT